MAAAVAVVAFAGPPAGASETDQFLAWGVEIADSSADLNRFLNQEFEVALERLDGKDRDLPCAAVPGRLYRHAFASIFSSRLRRYLKRNRVEWYPNREVSYWQYRARSVLRKKAFPVFIPMARTVRIGDVYLGVDKLAHLFGFGRRYHGRYQKYRRRGFSVEEAQRKTILWGLHVERTYVGGMVDGIISHADLEGNYQGLRLAREMCEGPDPYLERGEGGWRLRRPIDLRDYVNPGFDESYNNNYYAFYRWRLVKPILEEEVCPRLENEAARARLELYREIDRGSLSRRVIAEYYDKKGRRAPRRFPLEQVCGEGAISAHGVIAAGARAAGEARPRSPEE